MPSSSLNTVAGFFLFLSFLLGFLAYRKVPLKFFLLKTTEKNPSLDRWPTGPKPPTWGFFFSYRKIHRPKNLTLKRARSSWLTIVTVHLESEHRTAITTGWGHGTYLNASSFKDRGWLNNWSLNAIQPMEEFPRPRESCRTPYTRKEPNHRFIFIFFFLHDFINVPDCNN